MSQDNEDMEFYLAQELASAAISEFTLNEEVFRKAWSEAMANPEALQSGFGHRKTGFTLPEDIKNWNPEISQVGMHYEFLRDDIAALSEQGYTHVGHFTTIPDQDIAKVHKSLSSIGKHMSLAHFKENIKLLREEFPKSHYFLVQPVKQTSSPETATACLPCLPDGVRTNSSGAYFG